MERVDDDAPRQQAHAMDWPSFAGAADIFCYGSIALT